jgi:hypothetical protein
MKIQIENKTNIPTGLVERIVSASNLPSGRVLVIIGTDQMVRNAEEYGQCIPKYARDSQRCCLRTSAVRDLDWDAVVLLSTKACKYYDSHPAFFAELIGHELGHAFLCVTEPVLHFYCTFICRNFCGKWKIPWNEFPHERRFEQYGKAIAERTYSREQLEKEVEDLLSDEKRNDAIVLGDLLRVKSHMDLSGLKEEVVEFVAHYGGHEQIIQLWNKKRYESLAESRESITSKFPSIENLFLRGDNACQCDPEDSITHPPDSQS